MAEARKRTKDHTGEWKYKHSIVGFSAYREISDLPVTFQGMEISRSRSKGVKRSEKTTQVWKNNRIIWVAL